MKKIVVDLPKINRVAETDHPYSLFHFDFIPADSIVGGGELTFKISDTEDFIFSDVFTPTEFEYENGSNWTAVSGNTLSLTHLNSPRVRVKLEPIGAEKAKWVKIVYTEDFKVYESAPIIFSSFTEINFLPTVPIDTGSERPKKVKVVDKITANVSSPYTIKVEACNNPFDSVPSWEDMTEAYLAGKYHLFANRSKDSDKNWGIRVRYSIKKSNVTDEIEITEFYIAFVK